MFPKGREEKKDYMECDPHGARANARTKRRGAPALVRSVIQLRALSASCLFSLPPHGRIFTVIFKFLKQKLCAVPGYKLHTKHCKLVAAPQISHARTPKKKKKDPYSAAQQCQCQCHTPKNFPVPAGGQMSGNTQNVRSHHSPNSHNLVRVPSRTSPKSRDRLVHRPRQ